jgi:hypothetical protein
MTDIVERLRAAKFAEDWVVIFRRMREAADEIERLRIRLECKRKRTGKMCGCTTLDLCPIQEES